MTPSVGVAFIRRAFRSRLGGNILSLYALQGLNYLLPLLVLPYLLRVLGPKTYGTIAFAQSFMGYAVLLTDFGFNLSATRDISLARNDAGEVARIFWSTMAAKGVLLGTSVLVMVPLVASIPALRDAWQVFAICGLTVVGSSAFPQWYFQGLERMRAVALIQAIGKLATFIATFVFVHSPKDLLAAAAILSMPTVVAAAICALFLRRVAPVRLHRPRLADIRAAFASSWHLFQSIAAVSLYLNSNTFVLGLMSGTYSVGLYAISNKVALAAFNFITPVIQAIFPRASVVLRQSSRDGRRFVVRLMLALLPIGAALSALLIVLALPIVRTIAGEKFLDAVPVLRVMGTLPLLLTAAAVLSQVVMINLGLTKSLSRIYLVAGIVNLVSLPGLIRLYGAEGAALSLVLAELLGPILMLRVIRASGSLSAGVQSAVPNGR